jgi:hypothetical protein
MRVPRRHSHRHVPARRALHAAEGGSHVKEKRGAEDVATGGQLQEGCQMSFYVQTWFPLMTVALTAAICLSVVSFIMGHAKPQP